MKKFFYLFALATSLFLTSCSADEVAPLSVPEQPTESNMFVITDTNIATEILRVTVNGVHKTGSTTDKRMFEVQNGDVVKVFTDHEGNQPYYIKVKIGSGAEQTFNTAQGEAMNQTFTIQL